MSALAGVRWFDNRRRAALRDVREVLGRVSHRGPDGLFAATSGPCALGFAQCVTTPEAAHERQPFTADSGVVFAFDGRLDNAHELRRVLRAPASATPADVDVVAAAWNAWGVRSLERLIGDFAVSVWDPADRRLWLARDVFGLRPLLYRSYEGGLWWGSELQALARLGPVTVNEGMAAEYLADGVRSETETLVQGISRVPRASVLVLGTEGTLRIERYWTPQIERTRAFRDDHEPVEEFRTIFATAVAARLRSDRPIALMLSGGLDSSLIANETAIGDSRPGRSDVHTFTLSLPNHRSDETMYAQAVAAHAGLSSTVSPVGRATLAAIVADAERALDMPQPPNSVAANALSEAICNRGIRVCLNGVGGNEWFSGYHFPFADLLRQFRWFAMLARMRAFRQETPSYRPLGDLRLALWLQLPESIKRYVRRMMRLPRRPHWIQESFAARVNLIDRLRTPSDVPRLPTEQLRLMFQSATSAEQMFFTEYTERISAAFGCEERAPFLDRRLVEWALALPDDQRWRRGLGKIVLRNAAAAKLPSSIVARRRGPDFSFQTVDGLEQIGGRELIMAIARERADWIAPDAVLHLWNQMTGTAQPRGRGLGYYSWNLWMVVGVHLAARAIESDRRRTGNETTTAVVRDCTIPARASKEAI